MLRRSFGCMEAASAVDQLVARVSATQPGEPDAVRAAFTRELQRLRESPDRALAWLLDDADIIGEAYEQLISGADRRDLGQFQTPFWAADLMAAWLLQDRVRLLLDPGVGAGRLLFRAARRSPAPTRLAGFDIDPVSLEMARTNLALRGARGSFHELNFLTRAPLVAPDAVTCNPPYSRHHTLPNELKELIHTGFEERLGVRFSRLAGLHALFLVRAIEILPAGGRLAFITPAEWLDANYGRAVKDWVLSQVAVEGIILFPEDHLFFDGALTTAAITFMRKGGPSDKPTRLVHLPANVPTVDDVLQALAGTKTALRTSDVTLTSATRWSRPAATKSHAGTPLSGLARVRRGLATGNNNYFVVSEAARVEHGISIDDVRACITKPRLVEGIKLTSDDMARMRDDVPRWALDCERFGADESPSDPLYPYLAWGKQECDADQSYLARSRAPRWYMLERRSDCPILFTYFNRDNPRFIRNLAGAIPLNNFLIIEPNPEVDADALWRALNGPEVLKQLAESRRNYGGGMWKVEPKALGDIRVAL